MSESPQTELPLPAVPTVSPPAPPVATAQCARVKPIDRNQTMFRIVEVERLIEEDHPARAIWALTGQLDLGRFYAPIEAVDGVAGRPTWDPRLLVSLWVYAYSRGVGSAREVARRCEYDPAFQWLTGLEPINHHTLSDFRVAHGPALEELFAQVLGVLSAEGLVSLERVMHDGTKIQACAGADSFRRSESLQAHLEAARHQVKELAASGEELTVRQRAARERAACQRQQRLEQAVQELEKIQAAKTGEAARQAARVSVSDPESRIMKQSNGGYAPSYNVQVSTDAAHQIIVGVGVSQSASDYGELAGAVERVEQNLERKPAQMVVDGGFTCRETIVEMAAQGVDLVGSLPEHEGQSVGQMKRRGVSPEFYPAAFVYEAAQDLYRCPAGHELRYEGREQRTGVVQHLYRAPASVCEACRFRAQCCPQNGSKGRSIVRSQEAPEVEAFARKMQRPEAQAVYRQRGAVAEFSNAWIKAKLGLRQFHVRGWVKVQAETLWACLTYNIQQWIRLCWRVQPTG